MIVLPPYIRDQVTYNQVPKKDRWIFNKLEICERFGYEPYGPCGALMPAGTYCIRPIINLRGMGQGGFSKKTVREGAAINKPGYVWTQWETGMRSWVEYVNDEISSALKQVGWDEHMQLERYVEQPRDKAHQLPDILKGISRYMLVEYLGDTVIDIGPRHLIEDAKESIIKDYQKFDPSYTVEYIGKRGHYAPHMKRIQHDNGSYSWEELDTFVPRRIYT